MFDVNVPRGLEQQATKAQPHYPAEFFSRTVVDVSATRIKAEQEGKPIEDVDPILKQESYIRVFIPGEKYPTELLVQPHHKLEWSDEWKAFTQGASQTTGIPLSEWGRLETSQVLHLNSVGFFSIQSLATAPDVALTEIGPFARTLRAEAREYLSKALSDNTAKEREAEKKRIEELEEQVRQLVSANIQRDKKELTARK